MALKPDWCDSQVHLRRTGARMMSQLTGSAESKQNRIRWRKLKYMTSWEIIHLCNHLSHSSGHPVLVDQASLAAQTVLPRELGTDFTFFSGMTILTKWSNNFVAVYDTESFDHAWWASTHPHPRYRISICSFTYFSFCVCDESFANSVNAFFTEFQSEENCTARVAK